TIASRFNDPGVNHLFARLCASIDEVAKKHGAASSLWAPANVGPEQFTSRDPLIPGPRIRYLAEISANGRLAHTKTDEIVEAARKAYGLYQALRALHDPQLPAALDAYPENALSADKEDATRRELRASYNRALQEMGAEAVGELKRWPQRLKEVTQ